MASVSGCDLELGSQEDPRAIFAIEGTGKGRVWGELDGYCIDFEVRFYESNNAKDPNGLDHTDRSIPRVAERDISHLW